MTAPPERRAQAGDRHQRWNLRRRPAGPRSATRRRLGTVARLAGALVLIGTLYAGFAPGVQATVETNQPSAQDVAAGKALYETSCISCHGRNAQGVQDRGPSLIGVGPASVEFQVGTGRMPLSSQNAQAQRKPPVFNAEETRQLGAYIESLGGGPSIPDVSLAGGDVAVGGDLFRVNCSSCHAFGGGGGALSSGKTAPGLDQATDRQIYAAMLTGPQNMPVFGDNQLTIDEKKAIIAYVQNLQTDADPGGWGLGRLGPVSEGVAIFLVGIVALVFATLWIAGKS